MIGVSMTKRLFIILVALAGLVPAGCDDHASAGESRGNEREDKKGRKDDGGGKGRAKFKLGRIQHKAIAESSGIAASRKHPGVLWTHNDSGNGAYLFAITPEGELLGEYPVASVKNTDWEAVAADDSGHLYIADIGNNEGRRDRIAVYRLDEPDPASVTGKKKRGESLRVNATYRLKYPDKPFDAEALFVHNGRGYVISKLLSGKSAGLYAFDLTSPPTGEATLQHVCDLPLRSPVTDASISPDGQRLAVLTVTGPNVFKINGDVASAGKSEPASITYFDFKDMNMEGATFVPEGVVATTEEGQILLFENKLFEE